MKFAQHKDNKTALDQGALPNHQRASDAILRGNLINLFYDPLATRWLQVT
jgi:hypothetical protein